MSSTDSSRIFSRRPLGKGLGNERALACLMAGRKHRPRGHIETRPNGTFRAIVYAGVDPLTRKERYLRKSAKTHAQAEIELTKLQSQVDEQRHPRSAELIG